MASGGKKTLQASSATGVTRIPSQSDGAFTLHQTPRAASTIPVVDEEKVSDNKPPPTETKVEAKVQGLSTPRASISVGTTSPNAPNANAPMLGVPLKQEGARGSVPTITAYRRYHRNSGLFSQDELSIDVSVTASQELLAHLRFLEQGGDTTGGLAMPAGGEGGKFPHHPRSLAGSSIGGSSLGSGSDYLVMDHKRNRYRPFRRRWRRFQRKYKGCIFALVSSLTSSLASYFVHLLTSTGKYTASYCLLWRYIGVLFPGILIVLYYRFWNKEMIFDTVWPLHKKEQIVKFSLSVARTVVDTVAILLNYQAFHYLLQSETSTILNSKPIVVQLLAHFTLGEPWGITPIVMSFVAAIGVVVISKPPFLVNHLAMASQSKESQASTTEYVTERLPGVLLAMGSMLLSAIVYCILRYLKDVHYSVFSLFIGSGGVLFGIAMTFGLHEFVVPTDGVHVIYLICVASLVCLSSISIVIALQNEEAFVVSLVRSCDVIFSFIWEMCLDSKFPDWYSGGGALIIMFCVGVIFFRKYVTHQDPTKTIYRTFAFLTK